MKVPVPLSLILNGLVRNRKNIPRPSKSQQTQVPLLIASHLFIASGTQPQRLFFFFYIPYFTFLFFLSKVSSIFFVSFCPLFELFINCFISWVLPLRPSSSLALRTTPNLETFSPIFNNVRLQFAHSIWAGHRSHRPTTGLSYEIPSDRAA